MHHLDIPGVLWPDKWITAFKSVFINSNQERVQVLELWPVYSPAKAQRESIVGVCTKSNKSGREKAPVILFEGRIFHNRIAELIGLVGSKFIPDPGLPMPLAFLFVNAAINGVDFFIVQKMIAAAKIILPGGSIMIIILGKIVRVGAGGLKPR